MVDFFGRVSGRNLKNIIFEKFAPGVLGWVFDLSFTGCVLIRGFDQMFWPYVLTTWCGQERKLTAQRARI